MTQEPITDPQALAALLSRVAGRDREAFSTLYHVTSMKLFGVALRILKSRAMAEDVLQDAYVKIWERAGDFNPSRGSPIGWMAAIARNRALDEVRRNVRLVPADDDAMESIPDEALDALGAVTQGEQHRQLIGCLGGLDEERKKMILLAYCEGFSREELGRQFGHPVATIKTWLRRGLQSLKECLDA